MPNDAVTRHPIAAAPTPNDSTGRLSSLEQLALRGFTDGDAAALAALFAQVETWAAGLRGPRPTEARLQMVAQGVALTRARVLLLEAKRDEVLVKRDAAATELVERALTGEHRRLVALLAEHRLTCDGGSRSVSVTVGRADNVAVVAPMGR